MPIRGAIYGISAAAIWGGMYVVSDVVLEVVPPFTLLTIRILLGIIALAIVMRLQSTKIELPPKRVWWRIMGVGIIGIGFSLGAQFVGTAKSNAVNGALITSASPAFIVLFAMWLLQEKLTRQRIIAILLATLGVIVILNPADADFSSDTFIGNLFLASAAFTWGLYSVLVRKVTHDYQIETSWMVIGAFISGLLIIAPASALELTQNLIGEITFPIIFGMLYLGVISTAVAIWLWNRAFALVDASIAALFFFAQPLTGALLGVVFLGQAMTTRLWIGSVCILLGVLLSTQRSQTEMVQ